MNDMITDEDLKRVNFEYLNHIRRIKAAEEACKKSTTSWSRTFWYGTFKKLCKKYDKMDYFKKSIN